MLQLLHLCINTSKAAGLSEFFGSPVATVELLDSDWIQEVKDTNASS